MSALRKPNYNEEIFEGLKIDCNNCCGFCCVALYFTASDGFPNDKEAGKPCINLLPDFRCAIHKDLRFKGLKGCTAYDCFGAGQKVTKVTYAGLNWRQAPELANQMYDVFVVMRQLHEMLWYLADAVTFATDTSILDNLYQLIHETEALTNLDAKSLLALDIDLHRSKVNVLLRIASEPFHKGSVLQRHDFIGANLTKVNLIGANLAGKLLIAANMRNADLSRAILIGADLRDADIRGANLENCIFLTQAQVNVAKGDSNTKLPKTLVRPSYWDN